MILVFGGTTEGLNCAALLDFMSEGYFYSTRTKTGKSIGGVLLQGQMDRDQIKKFCLNNSIRIIIDAAHPFAINLHQNINDAARELELVTIRYERCYPPISPSDEICFFDSYERLKKSLLNSDYRNILFLTGVQTIKNFSGMWEERNTYFRILDTHLSRQKAEKTGIPHSFVFPQKPEDNTPKLVGLAESLNAEVIISKESGYSGFFESKVEAARELQIPLWVVSRPKLPVYNHIVSSRKDLLQLLYTLRRKVLKREGQLRSGFTTGSCVLACVKACFIALTEGCFPERVTIDLPGGGSANFIIFPHQLMKSKASCVVIKDGGDDPDVTHAKEIGCELELCMNRGVTFSRGNGIGLVTLPGLQVPVGEPAINPVPRKMISNMLEHLTNEYDMSTGFVVTPFVPEGEELAQKTFNPRVGVVGGISIIGTSGRVMPYSNKAFLESIKYQLSVAKQMGCSQIVISSGKRSENMVASHFNKLPKQAYIHFGNLVGETIKLAVDNGVKEISLAIMFGKGVKLAEGNLNTHSKEVQFNPCFAAQIAHQNGYELDVVTSIKELKLANAILDIIPFSHKEPFYMTIAQKCLGVCSQLMPKYYKIQIFLLSDKGDFIIAG